jgi:hypothetical protein
LFSCRCKSRVLALWGFIIGVDLKKVIDCNNHLRPRKNYWQCVLSHGASKPWDHLFGWDLGGILVPKYLCLKYPYERPLDKYRKHRVRHIERI